jgi:hypothetical protein
MSSVSLTAVPVNANPAALDALERFMLEQDYTGRCRSDARKIVGRTGCVADCVPSCLDQEHLEAAEAIYVDALPAVHQSSPSWDDRGVYLDLDSIEDAAAGRHFPLSLSIVPPEMDDIDAELAAFWPGGDDA